MLSKFKNSNLKKKIAYSVLLAACVTNLSGCGREAEIKEPIADNTTAGLITEQTSKLAVSQSSVSVATKDGEGTLINGWYYVVHHTPDTVDKKGRTVPGEDIYYPVVYYTDTYEGKAPSNYVDPYRLAFFTTENESNIPTLFLGQGDKLIYYSTDTLLDYIVWERYYDMKYTIGVWNLQQMTNGRVWVTLDDDDNEYILADSELYSIYDLGVTSVLFDKIGSVPIDGNMIKYGILTGATKSRQYDLEVYAGTYYNHYLTTANIRAFHAYELFASTEYETKQGYIYEINVPNYLVDGFYKINNAGFIRLVTGDSYNDTETDYNQRLLYPGTNRTGAVTEEMQASIDALLEGREDDVDWDLLGYPGMYSECPELNHFSTNLEGKLGYVPDEEPSEEPSEEKPETQMIEATTKEISLCFPAKTDCTVSIVSPSKETTGDCFLQVGNDIYKLTYDYLMGDYSRDFTFREETYGILHIQGLFNDCKVQLTGCTQKEAPVAEQMGESAAQETTGAETNSNENLEAQNQEPDEEE